MTAAISQHPILSSIISIVLILGCSPATITRAQRSPQNSDQAKFEIDESRNLILTHDAEAINQPTPWLVCESNLPILHIATAGNEIADEPKVLATLKILQPDADPEIFPIAIEWRGRTSQTFPKKSYSFELCGQNNRSTKIKQSLLGMRKDDDWILDALWNEPLGIRDFTAHQIWRQMATDHQDHDAYDLPQQRYVELFLDGQYRGVYYLGERVDRKMLKIAKYDDRPHGQLFKAVAWADGSSFKSAAPLKGNETQWNGFEKVYPDSPDNIDWTPLVRFVSFVANANEKDFGEGITSQIQMDNAVDYFIFINLLAAMDNRSKNYYLAKQNEASPWFFVPWDLDLTVGISFPTDRKDIVQSRMYNDLFRRLMRQPEFVQAVTDRWRHLRAGLFDEDNLKKRYRQNYHSLANNGIYDRQQRFPDLRFDFQPPSEEIEFIESWIEARIEFLDSWFGDTTRLVKRLQRQQNPTSRETVR